MARFKQITVDMSLYLKKNSKYAKTEECIGYKPTRLYQELVPLLWSRLDGY